MSRSPKNRDWVEPRSLGRREADRGVCIWHDVCHETVAQLKQDVIEQRKEMEAVKRSKLDSWVFKLLVSTGIPIAIALGGWIAVQTFETNKIVTKLDTNQRHLMQEFDVKPVEK